MKVSVERIRDLLKQLKEFDSLNLAEITLTENGEPIDIAPFLEDWKFIGLSNASFVELAFWSPESRAKHEEMKQEA